MSPITMKANDLLQENPNLHLTHLEDLALFQGKAGALRAVAFLRNLANLAKTSSTKKFNVTIKWDGSPAIVCGTDPSDGKFFVATKSAFNKDAKLNNMLGTGESFILTEYNKNKLIETIHNYIDFKKHFFKNLIFPNAWLSIFYFIFRKFTSIFKSK